MFATQVYPQGISATAWGKGEIRMKRRYEGALCLGLLCLLLLGVGASQAVAVTRPPYEFDAELSLTGGCGITKADEIPDPGCPEKKPPKGFTKPSAITIDSFGDEYVASWGGEEGKQGRIDIFSLKGVYITELKDEFGPKNVAIDSKGVLYTFDQRPGDNAEFARYKPTVYKPAEEKIEYGPRELIEEKLGPHEGGLAIDTNDHVLVDWSSSIKEYGSAEEANELKGTITNPKLQSSTFISLDKQRRRLYASSCHEGIFKCFVLVLNADKPSEVLEEVDGPSPEEEFVSTKGWISIAVDEKSGDFFIGDLELSEDIYQFDKNYAHVATLGIGSQFFEGGEPLQIALSNAEGAFNYEDLFVPSKGRALAFHPPEETEPEVVSVAAAGISEEEAELHATIKPNGGETHYVFEYLSQQEYEEAGNSFAGAKVAGEGSILPTAQEAEVKAPISGLSPETEYRFRVVAANGKGQDEEEATFTTYSDAPITTQCPEAIRSSYSALLPDCRAYELVTPADTNGRPPRGIGFVGDQFATLEASPQGEAVSFLVEGGVIPGFEGTGSFSGDLYHVARTSNGWNTQLAGPSGAETISVDEGSTSPDQGLSFWNATREGSAVIGGKGTRYVRYPDGHSALIGRGSLGTDPRARGKLITAGGTHIVFQTVDFNGDQPIQLEEDAPPTGTEAVYDRTPDEVTHVVSLLPGDETPKAGEDAKYVGASPDGNGIAFTIGKELYLRVGDQTTYEIGESVEFAGVSEGGARIFYVEGGNLIAFDVALEEDVVFAETGNAVPVNVSADGTRAYFASTTAIVGSSENPHEEVAQAGKENLYLSEEGTIRFVATVSERDVVGESRPNSGQIDGLGLWTLAVTSGHLAIDPSRATSNGTTLLFSSRANLDGYEHKEVPEIYRYDSVDNRLHCVSCIPTKVPATGGAELESYEEGQDDPQPFNFSGFVPNLSPNGRRAIFESTEALVSYDNDEVQDVYEWEEQGVGTCTRSGGCVYLISSGESGQANYLYGVSQSGSDVFFTTADVLAAGDGNTLSIYDARAGGGFAAEVEGGRPPCTEATECSGLPSPPPVFPAMETEGAPVPSPPPSKHCPKGTHEATKGGKQVCAKNKKKHHRKHNKTQKGAGK